MISTHLPPPVMTESTAVGICDPHVVLELWHDTFGRRPLRKDQGSMNLLRTPRRSLRRSRPGWLPSIGAQGGGPGLDDCHRPPGIPLEPLPVQVFGDVPSWTIKLPEGLGARLRRAFRAIGEEGTFVFAHDDSSIRTADKMATIVRRKLPVDLATVEAPDMESSQTCSMIAYASVTCDNSICPMPVTSAQVSRMARAAIGLTVRDLARGHGLRSKNMITNIEIGRYVVDPKTSEIIPLPRSERLASRNSLTRMVGDWECEERKHQKKAGAYN